MTAKLLIDGLFGMRGFITIVTRDAWETVLPVLITKNVKPESEYTIKGDRQYRFTFFAPADKDWPIGHVTMSTAEFESFVNEKMMSTKLNSMLGRLAEWHIGLSPILFKINVGGVEFEERPVRDAWVKIPGLDDDPAAMI